MSRVNIALSIASGLVGGGLSHYLLAPRAVEAQAPQPAPFPAPAPATPSEMRAQSFTLVDRTGATAGSFYVDPAGRPRLEVFDRGRRITIYPESMGIKPITGIPSR